ncbi:MAG: LysM peptidoglycan-binding domain-containing protein [Chloroflexota bacterium]
MKPSLTNPQWNSVITFCLLALIVGSCRPQPVSGVPLSISEEPSTASSEANSTPPTPLPKRPIYQPGQLVEYTAQPGDTLPALAAHFNTTEKEIREANPILPDTVTTLPPGLPMQIPIYYLPLWGSPYQILPDSLYINGPAQIGFDTTSFVAQHGGWLNAFSQYAAGANRTGAEIIDLVAQNFSISPRLLLAFTEYFLNSLSQTTLPPDLDRYPLRYEDRNHRGFYLQLVWVANTLNNGYYGWRSGHLTTFDLHEGLQVRPDPWQNAATVALHYFFGKILPTEQYEQAIGPEGFAQTYADLFGDPWLADQAHIPGSLEQPPLVLPFEPKHVWAFTGGPHTGWGEGEPLAALDFAPPAVVGGCNPSDEWVTAVAPGVVVRSEPATVVLDLDGDKDERTGWVIFYLHIGKEGQAPLGVELQTGDHIGHPSCEGGKATGTHVHIARKYNGEWIAAEGPLGFNLEGWVAHAGAQPYLGTLTRFGETVTACLCSNRESRIEAADR